VVQFVINKYGNNFLNFNFKYQEAQKKWKEMMTKYKKNFFLFGDIDKHDKFTHFSTGELLSGREFLNALNNDIPWQTTKKIGSSESAFYKETLFSPKVKQAKYTSNKTSKGVYDEMKTESTYLISYKEVNTKGKDLVKNDFVDLYVIEKYQLGHANSKEFAHFLASKVAKGNVTDAIVHTKIEKYQRVLYDNHDFYYISSNEMHNAKQLILQANILNDLTAINKSKQNVDIKHLQSTFKNIASQVIDEFNNFLPDSKINTLENFYETITDYDDFVHAVSELFKTTSASAARSK